MKLLSFDIEISDVFDLKPGEDINKYAPFHVSVASTVVDAGEERVWYSVDDGGRPLVDMTADKARELLRYLRDMQDSGHMVCAWNGLGFDLRWIGFTADDMELAGEVALKSYDPMFQFFNQRGFPVSLAAVGKAMGVEQRKLMSGEDAPKEWRAGNFEKVMDYVLGDSQITNQIIRAVLKQKCVRWVTQRCKVSSEPMPHLKMVGEVIRDPEPDQSWMDTPILKSKFFEWLPHS